MLPTGIDLHLEYELPDPISLRSTEGQVEGDSLVSQAHEMSICGACAKRACFKKKSISRLPFSRTIGRYVISILCPDL